MSFHGKSLIDFQSFTPADIYFLFNKVSEYEKMENEGNEAFFISQQNYFLRKQACLLFLEPSTRTQLSFDLACRDVGLRPFVFTAENSSFKKGETLLDTLLNLQAMGFHLFIIRHGNENESLKELTKKIRVPIINAGEGVSGHPTQALLDVYTILRERKDLSKEKVLFIGDVKHSRVVSSNIELLKKLEVPYGFCGPRELMTQEALEGKYFPDLKSGLQWASVAVALRAQLERHNDVNFENFKSDFIKNFCLTKEQLKHARSDIMILHPGPYNRDVEIASDLLDDERVFIFKQVEDGRKIRRALISAIIGPE